MQADRSRSFRHNERDNDVTEPSTTRPEGVQLRARRNPRLIALGVLLIVLGALGTAPCTRPRPTTGRQSRWRMT